MSNFEVSTMPLPQEVIKLGLGDSEFLLPGEQVKARYGIAEDGIGKIILYVHDIEITSMDPDRKNVQYRVTGLKQYTQNWDVGGAYLDPKFIDTSIGKIDDGSE